MRDKLESIIERYNSIQDQMAESEIISNPEKAKPPQQIGCMFIGINLG